MSNYFKDWKLRDLRASKLVEKIQKQEKKPFEKGETPAETLVNLHNSEVLEDFNSWLNGLEHSVTEDLLKQIAALKSKTASLSIALALMRSGLSSAPKQAPASSSMQGEAYLKPRSNASALQTSYDKAFYLYHYGVSYDPTGHNGPIY